MPRRPRRRRGLPRLPDAPEPFPLPTPPVVRPPEPRVEPMVFPRLPTSPAPRSPDIRVTPAPRGPDFPPRLPPGRPVQRDVFGNIKIVSGIGCTTDAECERMFGPPPGTEPPPKVPPATPGSLIQITNQPASVFFRRLTDLLGVRRRERLSELAQERRSRATPTPATPPIVDIPPVPIPPAGVVPRVGFLSLPTPQPVPQEDLCRACATARRRRRRERSKCIQRYNVAWTSGPDKGRLAGSRCYASTDLGREARRVGRRVGRRIGSAVTRLF